MAFKGIVSLDFEGLQRALVPLVQYICPFSYIFIHNLFLYIHSEVHSIAGNQDEIPLRDNIKGIVSRDFRVLHTA